MTPGERSYESGFMAAVAGYVLDEQIQQPATYRRGVQDGRRHKARGCICDWCTAAKRRAADLEAIEVEFAVDGKESP